MGELSAKAIRTELDPADVFSPVSADSASSSQIERAFRRSLAGGRKLVASGSATSDPSVLLSGGFTPKSKLSLFGTDIYLTRPRQNPDLRFFVAYVAPAQQPSKMFARIFYKDISLIWRCASHLFLDGDEMWIGKGDVRVDHRGGYAYTESVESTTDLPFELQTAIELLNRAKSVRQEFAVLGKVLRPATRNRIRAYSDFTGPRTRARNQGRIIAKDKKVVHFKNLRDPSSLEVLPGYEPDWDDGLVETYSHPSRLYGGTVTRYRFMSMNREIQHLLFLAPKHAWMIPPQALNTDITSFAVRSTDVNFDEEAYVPGFEYHFEEAGELHSQIPEGYVGALSEIDDSRADASAWLNQIPLLQELRKRYG